MYYHACGSWDPWGGGGGGGGLSPAPPSLNGTLLELLSMPVIKMIPIIYIYIYNVVFYFLLYTPALSWIPCPDLFCCGRVCM